MSKNNSHEVNKFAIKASSSGTFSNRWFYKFPINFKPVRIPTKSTHGTSRQIPAMSTATGDSVNDNDYICHCQLIFISIKNVILMKSIYLPARQVPAVCSVTSDSRSRIALCINYQLIFKSVRNITKSIH